MKKLLFLAAIICFAASCETPDGDGKKGGSVEPAKPIVLPTRSAEKVAADNTFAFDFFRQTLATAPEKDKENGFVSPLSLTMALGMTYNGTSPEAGAEMAAALGVPDFTSEEINAHYKALVEALLAADPLTVLAIANSIWTREGFGVKPTFYELNRTYYDAEVQTRDFGDPATVDEINGWCDEKTRGKITEIIEAIGGHVVMYLINAVYFKGQWKYEFDKKETRDEDFYLADGSMKKVKMMAQTATLPYYWNEAVQCIELPYGNGAFGMVVMMPSERDGSLDDLVASLDAAAYNDITTGLQEREVTVKLPRFKQECEFPLNVAIENLGIRRIFGGGSLSGINDDPRLAVTSIIQKTFVEVNEEGTEAAAVTLVEFGITSVGPDPVPIPFHADRPFLYLIRERSTGAILFMGRMDNPSE